MGTVIRNVLVWLPPPRAAVRADIRFVGNTIAAVGAVETTTDAEDTIVNGDGRLAIPGLVNSHTHVAMSLLRGVGDDAPLDVWLEDHIWPLERRLSEEDIYWGTLLGLAEMIRSGTTQIADMYFHVDAVGRAVQEAGIRATLGYGVVAERLDEHGRRELDLTEATIDRWQNAAKGRIQTAICPHAPFTCGEDVWRAAVRLRERYNVPIHTHLAETKKEVDDWTRTHKESPACSLSRFGVFAGATIAAHCVHLSREDIQVLAKHRVAVVHCPSSNAKLASGVAPVVDMLREGVAVALGTDGAASNNNLDLAREMRMALMLGKLTSKDATALTADQAMTMATVNGGRALGTPTGTLAAGDRADIVLVDLDRVHTLPVRDPASSMAYAVQPQNVADVIIDGQWVMRDGELLTIDEGAVKQETSRRAQRLDH